MKNHNIMKEPIGPMEKLCFPLFTIADVDQYVDSVACFYAQPVSARMTNVPCGNALPSPCFFDLMGISGYIADTKDRRDYSSIRKAILDFSIGGKTAVRIPFASCYFENTSIQEIHKIYNTFQEKLQETQEMSTADLIDFHIKSSGNDPSLYIYFPLVIQENALRIDAHMPFQVYLMFDEPTREKSKVVIMLHGLYSRPIL